MININSVNTSSDFRKCMEFDSGVSIGYTKGNFDYWKVVCLKDGAPLSDLDTDADWLKCFVGIAKVNKKYLQSGKTKESFLRWFLFSFVETIPPVINNINMCYEPSKDNKDYNTRFCMLEARERAIEYYNRHKEELSEINFPKDYDFQTVMMTLWSMMLSEQNKLLGGKDNFYTPILGCVLKIFASFRGTFNMTAVLNNGDKLFPVMENGVYVRKKMTARFIANEVKKENISEYYDSDFLKKEEYGDKPYFLHIWDKMCEYLKKNEDKLNKLNLTSDEVILVMKRLSNQNKIERISNGKY